MLLQPHSELVTRKVTGHSKEKRYRDVHTSSRWNRLFAKSHDVFNPPGMERDTVHKIELVPNAEPHYRH